MEIEKTEWVNLDISEEDIRKKFKSELVKYKEFAEEEAYWDSTSKCFHLSFTRKVK